MTSTTSVRDELDRLRDEGVIQPDEVAAIRAPEGAHRPRFQLVTHHLADGVPVSARSSIMVFLLSVLTLGAYTVVWFYAANRELASVTRARLGEREAFSPLLWTLLIAPGQIILILFLISAFFLGLDIEQLSNVWLGLQDASTLPGLESDWLASAATLTMIGTITVSSLLAFAAYPVMASRVRRLQAASGVPEPERISVATYWTLYVVMSVLSTTPLAILGAPALLMYIQWHLTAMWRRSPRRLRVA